MAKTFNINIESLIGQMHISCKPEDVQNMKGMVTKGLLEALGDSINSDKKGLVRGWIYTKDDMIKFATYFYEELADLTGHTHNPDINDLKNWENKKK